MTLQEYTNALKSGNYKKLVYMYFLNTDGTIAFTLSNNYNANAVFDSRCFIQSGSLSVSLQNGIRRQANITLANVDEAFSYAVNHIWYGTTIRLDMGIENETGDTIYFPQGIFVITNPENNITPSTKTITYKLVDKWANIDGTLGGKLTSTYQLNRLSNIYTAMASLLSYDKYTMDATTNDNNRKIDNQTPVFTDYYNSKTMTYYYSDGTSETVNGNQATYDMTSDGTIASLLLELNEMNAGIIGYDSNGQLRVDPSDDDIEDNNKPILWSFNPNTDAIICSYKETIKNTEVYNDVIINGEGLNEAVCWGRAENNDAKSDTNILLIGRKTYIESRSGYTTPEQCKWLAKWILKRKTTLQKTISISCGQMFHLFENGLIELKRIDKEGEPIEKHLIQSYTIPIAETGNMTINCVSVNDSPVINITDSTSV